MSALLLLFALVAQGPPLHRAGEAITLEAEPTYLAEFPQIVVVSYTNPTEHADRFDAFNVFDVSELVGRLSLEIDNGRRRWRIRGTIRPSPETHVLLGTEVLPGHGHRNGGRDIGPHETQRFPFDLSAYEAHLPPGDYTVVARWPVGVPLFPGEQAPSSVEIPIASAHFKVLPASLQDRKVARACREMGGFRDWIRRNRPCSVEGASEQGQQQAGYYFYLSRLKRREQARRELRTGPKKVQGEATSSPDPDEPIRLFGRGILRPWAELARIGVLENIDGSAAEKAKQEFRDRWPAMGANPTRHGGCELFRLGDVR